MCLPREQVRWRLDAEEPFLIAIKRKESMAYV